MKRAEHSPLIDSFDAVIVGAGAIGIFLASALAQTGQRVAVVEIGPRKSPSRPDPLEVRIEGVHRGVNSGRLEGFGGTTRVWGGQLWPWKEPEFQRSGFAGIPSWPIEPFEVVDQYEHVLRAITNRSSGHALVHARQVQDIAVPGWTSSSSTWLSRHERDFRRNPMISPHLRRVRFFFQHSLVEVQQVGRSWDLHLRDRLNPLSQPRLISRTVIFAAGTIGNMQTLRLTGLAPPTLGYGFMDHVSARTAELAIFDPSRWYPSQASRYQFGVRTTPKWVPEAPGVLDTSPAFAHWEYPRQYLEVSRVVSQPFSATHELASVCRRRLAQGVHPSSSGAKVFLRIDVEEPPIATNRATWTPRSNEMKLAWSPSAGSIQAIQAHSLKFLSDFPFEKLGARLVGILDPSDSVADTFHMMGGTRMGCNVAESTVDTDLQIHGLSGVYVAGASVFPSGGLANPTITALALAARLAERLRF